MKKSKVKEYLAIFSVPVIFIAIIILLFIYNYFTGKIINFIPDLYEFGSIIIFVNVAFLIYNIRDYKKGKL